MLCGFAVLTLVAIAGAAWGMWARLFHGVYGISVIAAAVFAHRPWEDVPFDAFEDFLHSVASFGVGVGFAVGVVIVSMRRSPEAGPIRVLDVLAVAAAILVSMIMFNVAGIGGVVQRGMFLIAYVWYGAEGMRFARAGEPVSSESGQTARA